MSIKEIHELPAQVFGGSGWRDALNEVESEGRGVKVDDIACSIQKSGGKKKLDHSQKIPNLARTEGEIVAEMLSG